MANPHNRILKQIRGEHSQTSTQHSLDSLCRQERTLPPAFLGDSGDFYAKIHMKNQGCCADTRTNLINLVLCLFSLVGRIFALNLQPCRWLFLPLKVKSESVIFANLSVVLSASCRFCLRPRFRLVLKTQKPIFSTFISLICLKHVIVRRWKDKNKSKSAALRSGLGR